MPALCNRASGASASRAPVDGHQGRRGEERVQQRDDQPGTCQLHQVDQPARNRTDQQICQRLFLDVILDHPRREQQCGQRQERIGNQAKDQHGLDILELVRVSEPMGKDREENRQGKEHAQDQQPSPANLAGRGDVQKGCKREKGTRRESRTGHSRSADTPRKSGGMALPWEPAEAGPATKGSSKPGSAPGPGWGRRGPDGSLATGFMGSPGT